MAEKSHHRLHLYLRFDVNAVNGGMLQNGCLALGQRSTMLLSSFRSDYAMKIQHLPEEKGLKLKSIVLKNDICILNEIRYVKFCLDLTINSNCIQ